MPRYKIKATRPDSGDESGYESEGKTVYSAGKTIGEGEYARARLFKSTSEKSVVVLNPVTMPGDIEEARIKHRFFQMVYPERKSYLLTMKDSYRLIIPYIPYVPYKKLIIDTPELQKTLFLSAIQALQDCHEKGIMVIDLKSDNIYYDSVTQKSYLIDGGLSAPTGTPIDPSAFQKSSAKIVEQHKREYVHIPPECWSVTPTMVLATAEMDVYCLGIVMLDVLKAPSPEVRSLISDCLKKNPTSRPTLEHLKNQLHGSSYKLML